MITIAFDCSGTCNNENWLKCWKSLSPGVVIYDCVSPNGALKSIEESCQTDAVLVLVHQEKCAGRIGHLVEGLLECNPKLSIMYVTGGSQSKTDNPDSPRVHYSRHVVPSGQDLKYMKELFSKLCKTLAEAGTDTEKISLAWKEWERPALEQLLVLLAPLAVSEDRSSLGGCVGKAIREGMGEQRMQLAASELKDDEPGEKALANLLSCSDPNGDSLVAWANNYRSTLHVLARRYL